MKKALALLMVFLFLTRGMSQAQPGQSPVSWDGFELFSYLCSRFPVKMVSDFSEVKNSPKGIVIVLGSERGPGLPWSSIENWVRQGGSLLVATDTRPGVGMELAVSRLTGYQWNGNFIRHKSPTGLDSLPQNYFPGNNFVIGVDWSKPKSGMNPLGELFGQRLFGSGDDSPSRVFLNQGTYLSPTTGWENSAILGRYPRGVVEESPVSDMSNFRSSLFLYGCLARPEKKGVVIQLADKDIFSNQMMELKENVEFAWWCLEELCQGGNEPVEGPIPLLLVARGEVQGPYSLPGPQIPLPDLDPYTALSLATRALDEVLPSWETEGGLFDTFSKRITSENYRKNVIGIIGICLFVLGIYLIFRIRGNVRAREIATLNATVLSRSLKPGSKANQESKIQIKAILDEFDSLMKRHRLSFWQVPELEWVEKAPGSDPRGSRKWKKIKSGILSFFFQDSNSKKNIKLSEIANIRGQLALLDDLLKKGLAKVSKVGPGKGEPLV